MMKMSLNPQLICIKMFLLCYFGSILSFEPFVPLQGISAGVSMDQLAIVNLVVPVGAVLGPLAAGYAADKTGHYKVVFLSFLSSMCVTTWGFKLLYKMSNCSQIQFPNQSNETIDLNCMNETMSYRSEDVFSPFGKYFLLCLLLTFFIEGSSSLSDSIVIHITSLHNADLGKQRLFVSLGFAIFPPLSGYLVDLTLDSNWKGLEPYSTTIYLSTAMVGLTLMVLNPLRVGTMQRANEDHSGLWDLLKQVDVICYLAVYLVAGSIAGFAFSFEFAYLSSLKAPSFLQGLPGTVGSLATVFVLYLSGRLVDRLGPARLLMLALTVLCFKYLGFSFLTNPWYALLCGLFNSLTYPLIHLSAAYFCRQNAPPGLLATLTGVFSALYFGLGRGIGGSIGGALIQSCGYRVPYRVFGTVAGVVAAVYYLVHHFKLESIEGIRSKMTGDNSVSVSHAFQVDAKKKTPD